MGQLNYIACIQQTKMGRGSDRAVGVNLEAVESKTEGRMIGSGNQQRGHTSSAFRAACYAACCALHSVPPAGTLRRMNSFTFKGAVH